MQFQKIRTLAGPNFYHYKPVLIGTIQLGARAETHSAALPGFSARLLELIPSLCEDRCSLGRAGGFEERLARGTYFAHIIEHVALALSEKAGIPAYYGKTVYAGEPGLYNVVVRYQNEEGMKFLLQEAAALVEALAETRPYNLEACLRRAETVVRNTELGPSTRAIVEAAQRRGIPWKRLGPESLIQLGYGRNRVYLQATTTGRTSDIAVDIAQDKDLTKEILRRAALPVPQGEPVTCGADAVEAWKRIGAPVAVKPFDSHHGNGVSLGLDDEESVLRGYLRAAEHSPRVLVEEYFPGKDVRVLVVGGKYVAASHRQPAFVTGDGAATLDELIDRENLDPRRGDGHEKPLTRIVKDETLLACLRRQQLSLDHVPGAGTVVPLRETANLSTGGMAVDLTDELHPSLRRLSEIAADVVGLDVCGVDLIVEDPSLPLLGQKVVILELNAGPGIRMHHHPASGRARDAGEAILNHLIPPGTDARIPIVSVTGTNGKTTVTRLLGHFVQESGRTAGVTTSDGILVGGELIAEGDTTGPRSAEAVLSNPRVDVAVLETARGGIIRAGLAYDWSDVAVLTNVQLDHIGQDGIESLEDIVRIKALVAERVREGGTLVLNAEDPNLLRIAETKAVRRVPRSVTLFSLNPEQIALRRHVAQGGTAFFERGGTLFEAGPEGEIALVRSAEIPLTYGGTARFQTANVLAAVAGARALGLPREVIVAALGTFTPNEMNTGRANAYRFGKGYLLVDYGHNPEAFRAICDMTAFWTSRRVTGIIGLPGDRSNGMIQAAAQAAARGFDRIFVREDHDLRGRRPGETAELVCQAVHDEEPSLVCHVEPEGTRCLERAAADMEDGEVIVFFYEDFETARELVAKHGAEAIADPREIFRGANRAAG